MIFLIHYRHRGAAPVVVTHGIGRAARELPGRVADPVATRHTVTAAARPAGSVATRRNTQGRTR